MSSDEEPLPTQPSVTEDDEKIIGGVVRIGALGCIPVLLIIAGIILTTSGAFAAIGPRVNDVLFSFGGLPLVLAIVGAFMAVAAIGSAVTRRR